jgi:hypothetical protein
MIKMIAAVCRRPGMTHAECVAYHHQVHGALSREVPTALRHYMQNHVFDSAFGTAAEATHGQVVARDSVAELYWDDADGMRATFGHAHVQQKVGPDGPRFSDVLSTANMVAHEVPLPVPQPGPGNAKVMHFLRAAQGVDLATFFARWTAAHSHALAQAPAAAQALRRAVQNRQIPEANPMLAYFGSRGLPHEGVAALWFDDEASIGLFRAYEAALLAFNANPAQTFYVPGESFFVYAREARIL